METSINNKCKAFTSLEQSKKLAEILPIESADHHYVRKTCDFMGNPVDGKWSEPKYGNPNSKYAHYIVQNFSSYETLPAWSLAALLGVLPKYIDGSVLRMDMSENDFNLWFDDLSGIVNILLPVITKDNPIDACYEMVLKLNELNLL